MISTNIKQKYWKIFLNHFFPDREKILSGSKLLYYTNADTAKKIIQNKEIWLRNARLMNDETEISFGLDGMRKIWNSQIGKSLFAEVEKYLPGIFSEVASRLNNYQNDWEKETYLTCLSLQDPLDEYLTGRLSMWRTYGDIALVINPYIESKSDDSGIRSLPIEYCQEIDFEYKLEKLAKFTGYHVRDLQNTPDKGREVVIEWITGLIYFTAICTKHPGFSEEKEWRIFVNPTGRTPPAMEKKVETIGGIVQPILKANFNPEREPYLVDIPDLIDSIIIGPTTYPDILHDAFTQLLADVGVKNTEEKVIFSNIPLRK